MCGEVADVAIPPPTLSKNQFQINWNDPDPPEPHLSSSEALQSKIQSRGAISRPRPPCSLGSSLLDCQFLARHSIVGLASIEQGKFPS